MSIVRSPRPVTNFSILDNRIAEDSSLSWGARGLLVFLLSKPDNWSISVSHLIKCTCGAKKKTGRDGVYALINELIDEGYLTRVVQSKVDGKFSEMEYVVHDVKQDKKACPHTDLPHTVKPDTVKPHTANPTLTRTDIKQELIGNNNGVKNNTRQARNMKADDSSSFSPKDRLIENGVAEQVANDWLQLRKSKKSAVTLTAINGIANEAKKAGVSLNQALAVCCQNGWSGFRADWIKPKTTNGSARLQGKALEDHNREVSRKFLLSRGIDPDTGEELKNVADGERGDDQKLIDFFGEGN